MRNITEYVVVRQDAEDGQSFVVGVYSSEEKAESIVDRLSENDEDAGEYDIVPRILDAYPQHT